jgi:glycosyltransferase involved in cell wall biosynthesis
MKIALITDGIWPYVLGGMQKHSYYICKYLAKNGVDVDLVHFNRSNYDISKLEFFTEEEKKHINSVIVDFPEGNSMPGHYIRRSHEHSKKIFEAIKDKLHTYDFIYTKGFTGWYLIDEKKKGAVKCAKIGVKFHGYEMFQKAPDLKTLLQYIFLLRKPVKHISLSADVVFSYGGKITEIIRSLGVPQYRIFELPSGVESSMLAEEIVPANGKIKFLYLGRYERRKGVEELNQALSKMRYKNYEFHFIGPIPETKKIEKENIFYHGEIRDRNQLKQMIHTCDVLVCPSWSEGMPNAILEAMASGLAIVATNAGATSVLVSENTGWLISNSEPSTISKAIRDVLSVDVRTINFKKQNALNRMKEHFVWEKLGQDLLNKLKSLSS